MTVPKPRTAYVSAFPSARSDSGRVREWGWAAQLADGSRIHLVDGGFRTKGSAKLAAEKWARGKRYRVAAGPIESPRPTVPRVRQVLIAMTTDPDVNFDSAWFHESGGKVTFHRDDFGIIVIHPSWSWKARKAVIAALWDAGYATVTGEEHGEKYVRVQRRGQVELGTLEGPRR